MIGLIFGASKSVSESVKYHIISTQWVLYNLDNVNSKKGPEETIVPNFHTSGMALSVLFTGTGLFETLIRRKGIKTR